MNIRLSALLLGGLLSLVVACSTESDPSFGDGESHFLMACDESAECGDALACICNVCTRACDAPSDCPDHAAEVVCVDHAEAYPGCEAPAPGPLCAEVPAPETDAADVGVPPSDARDDAEPEPDVATDAPSDTPAEVVDVATDGPDDEPDAAGDTRDVTIEASDAPTEVSDAPTEVSDAPTEVSDAPTEVSDAPTDVAEDTDEDTEAHVDAPDVTFDAVDGRDTAVDAIDTGDAVICRAGTTREADDGCNICTCVEGHRWACTTRACPAPECESAEDCIVTGCSDQLCAAEATATTCEFRAEYACFASAVTSCACVEHRCAWRPTPALEECLLDPPCVPGETRRAGDGCNTCECTREGRWSCTEIACPHDDELLCTETGGTWDEGSCGHYRCGRFPDCDAVDPGCDCGRRANFVDGVGCVADEVCVLTTEGRRLCEDTGGEWRRDSCGHYDCGAPPDCLAVIPGCDCGDAHRFDADSGCERVTDCPSADGGS